MGNSLLYTCIYLSIRFFLLRKYSVDFVLSLSPYSPLPYNPLSSFPSLHRVFHKRKNTLSGACLVPLWMFSFLGSCKPSRIYARFLGVSAFDRRKKNSQKFFVFFLLFFSFYWFFFPLTASPYGDIIGLQSNGGRLQVDKQAPPKGATKMSVYINGIAATYTDLQALFHNLRNKKDGLRRAYVRKNCLHFVTV